MARTELDKYHRIVWAFERGYYPASFVLDYMIQRLEEFPHLLGGFLAMSPATIVKCLDEWAAEYPADEEAWQKWMTAERWHLPSGQQVTEEEKRRTRAVVERVRQGNNPRSQL